MNASDLLAGLRAEYSSDELSDDNANIIIDRVFRLYNRYRPQVADSTITTVAYQAEYDIDADAMDVLMVMWEPSNTSDIISRVMVEIKATQTDFNYPSLMDIYYQKYHALKRITDGHWRKKGHKIELIPAPTVSGTVVPYVYTKPWESLEEVPLRDEGLLIDGALILARLSIARRNAVSGGWAAGEYRVDGGSVSADANRAIAEYNWFLSRLAGGAVGART